MAYRRPAVTVIQEFLGLVPALAQFSLPTVVVAPAYQLVPSDNLGAYSGIQILSAWGSLMAGAQVDLEELASDEQFPATKLPVSVKLTNAKVEILASQSTGAGNDTAFTDATASQFANVVAGDLIVVVPALGVQIIGPQTDGASVATSGLTDRLTAGVAGEFASVKAGDSVVITGGTNTTAGTYTVSVVIDASTLKLSAPINTGVASSSNVAYSISGDRGVANAGSYIVRSKTDANTLVLQGALAEPEAPITYSVQRKVASIPIPRATLSDPAGFTPTTAGLDMPAGLLYQGNSIVTGTMIVAYRGLRNDMAANVREFAKLSDLQAFFGTTQITPANPLAYGLSIQLQNTTTAINGLGLDGAAVSNETLSHQNAGDVLAMTEMYAIVPLTQSPAIHQIWNTHVTGLSAVGAGKERIVILNRKLQTEELVAAERTTAIGSAGARIIRNTQVSGAGVSASASTVNDATPNQFLNVKKGDTLVVVGGTNATPGEYPVLTIPTSNQLTVTGNVFTGTCNDLQYYIVRQDGIGADGQDFFDRGATFISGGAAPGYTFRILSGSSAGDYPIASIQSDRELTLAQIPGIVTLQVGIDYEIVRTLSKTEQATFLAGYSSSFANRRVVMVWPDVVQAPVGTVIQDLPGYYAGCAVGAMVTGLATQQGFTNLTISGFLGLQHSNGYFTDDQLNTIAGGGTFIFGQAGDQQPLYVRHQLTTDLSAIKYQELSVTKNVDYISKFLRNTFAPYIGKYNIVDSTFDELRGTAKAVITFLKDDTRLPRVGGVIRSGQLTKLIQDPSNIDAILMTFSLDIPIPLNHLDITVQV